MSEPRWQELCDGRALGLLDPDESAELDALAQSPQPAIKNEIGKAMRNSEETIAWLAWGTAPVPPPAALRHRILQQAQAEPPARHPLQVLSISDARDEARRKPPLVQSMAWLGWAAAAGLGISALWLNNHAERITAQLAEAQHETAVLRAGLAQREQVLRVIGARDSRTIRLVTTAPEAPQFRAYWSDTAGLVLAGNQVARPAPGRTLQLWIVPKQGAPIPAGVFAPTAQGEVLLVASATLSRTGDAQALAISDEPTGGSAQPTTTPAWVGALSGF
jgi:hypothetical protein